MLWRICPKYFEWTWIGPSGLPGLLNTDTLHSSTGVEMQFGRIFHYFAQRFFKEVNYEALLKCKTAKEALKVFSPLTVDNPVVRPWVENFKEFEARQWEICHDSYSEPLYYWTPLVTEAELISSKYGLLMHVDRIDRVEEHSLMNIEYKTNKFWNIARLREETALYNIGINDRKPYPDPCLYIGCYNPQLNRAFKERISTRLLRRVLRLLLQFKHSIRDKDFPYNPSHFCRYCGRLSECLEENFGE